MEEQTHFALQVVRVNGAASRAKDTAAYVEIKLAKSVRKTGILNDEGEPAWNWTMTFPKLGTASVFKIRLKEIRKIGLHDLVGQAEVNVDELVANSSGDNTRVVLFAPTSFLSNRKQPSSTGSIDLHLKKVDALNRAKIEIETAEKSAEQIQTLANKTDSTMEVIGTVIEAADAIIEMVDTIAKIHPIFDVSWQATSALYKVVSHQLHTDKELIDLIAKMKTAFKFSTEAGNLDDKTEMLKPIVKDLLNQTVECSRFVQKYTEHNFFGRMGRLGSRRKLSDYSARFVDLRNDLDSVIGLNTAKEVLDIKSQQQLEALLEPSKSDPSRASERPRCLEGTRREYLNTIMDFLFAETSPNVSSSPNVSWLTGAAGSGKSTIATTVFDKCEEERYQPVYMFFEREKSDPSSVIRTLAYLLAILHPSITRHILGVLELNKNICKTTIKNQFEKLLLGPLRDTASLVEGRIVVILDALDECGSVERRRNLLQLLKTEFTALPPKVRILVTSRPEADIMVDLLQNDRIRHIELEHGTKESRHDVDLYIRQEMEQAIGKRIPKGKAWDDSLRVLCDAADGLFIWASTAIRMVRSPGDRRRNLQQLVDNIRSLGEHGLYDLYVTALKGSGIWQSNLRDIGTTVLGLILVAKEALTGAVIESFLGLEEDTVDPILNQLQSVISHEPGKPVRLHHASFADYLLSSGRSGKEPWHVDETRQKQSVVERCFDVMAEKLHFNMCSIESSFLRNSEIPQLDERVMDKIPPHLDYACRLWAVHLHELEWSDGLTAVRDKLKDFASVHLLYWLEVLSLTGCFIRVAGRSLHVASSWTTLIDAELSSFLWTAYKLVVAFEYPISQSAPHIYLSAISLWKGESLIADHYSKSHPVVNVDRLGRRTPGQCIKVLKGHTSDVNSVAVSADGERIASGAEDATVRVWSAFSGELIAGPFKADHAVWSVSFSPDGNQVVSGSTKGTIHAWDVDTGSRVSVFKASDSWITSVAFSSDSRRVIAVSDEKVFYYENGELVSAQFEDDTDFEFRKVTPDGKYVLGSKDRMIGIWDAGTGKRVSAPINVGEKVNVIGFFSSMAVSPDGKLLATVSGLGTCIWNVDSGELVTELSHASHVVAFSPDGKYVVSGGWEIAIFSVDSGQRIWAQGDTSPITSIIFTPDGKRVISGSRDNTIRIWDAGGSIEIESRASEAHTGRVTSVAFSADGKRIVSGSFDKTIRVWDADSGRLLVDPFEDHTSRINSVSFSPDDTRVISGSYDETIRIWNAETGKLLAGPFEAHLEAAGCTQIGRHSCPVHSVAFSPNGKHFASPSCDNTICIRDADTGTLVSGPFKGHTATINSVGYSPDGKRVVSGSQDKTICIWEAVSGKLVLDPLEGHTGRVNLVAFSANGERVASGSDDMTICIWDAGTGKLISGPLKGHRDAVTSVCFSPDGRCVISGSWDETIRIWDADTWELVLGPLEGHTSAVLSVAISPDGTRIVSGSYDKTFRVWDVGGGDIIPGRGGRIAKGTVSISSSSYRADAHTGSNDQGTGPAASRERTLLNWTLSEDGWVKGEGGELLTWIPEDMRGTLWRPRNTVVFSCKFSTKLDLQNSPVGEEWAKDYSK